MKKILISLLVVLSTFWGCGEKSEVEAVCSTNGGVEFTAKLGRVYLSSDSKFYYIGNPDPTRKGAGFIACNDIPKRYQKDGLAVKYSGVDKGSLPGTDPLFVYFVLKKIEEVK